MAKTISAADLLAFLAENPETLASLKDADTIEDVAATLSKGRALEIVENKTEMTGDDAEEFLSVLVNVAEVVAESVSITAGDPSGKQDRVKKDRHIITVPTAHGDLAIVLYRH